MFTSTGLIHRGLTFNFLLLLCKHYDYDFNVKKQKSIQRKIKHANFRSVLCFAGNYLKAKYLPYFQLFLIVFSFSFSVMY